MRIRWTPAAAADLESISEYIRERRPAYREATLRRLYAKARTLKASPYLGRPGMVEGTRELTFAPLPFVAIYRIHGETVEIWRIFHGAQART